MSNLLEVSNLRVRYATGKISLPALNGVTLEVGPGEVVGVLGESGCGKTTLGLAIMRLLPRGGRIVGGSVRFRNRELLRLTERELQTVRGAGVSMIFQEPDLALNPFIRAREQVEEVIRAHRRLSREDCRAEALRALSEVGLDRDRHTLSAYPHELSGGQRQRLVIAQAIACKPALLIADEPSASLDPILESQCLALIREFCDRRGLSVLLITHNPAILAGLANRVLVMYAGCIIESGRLEQIIQSPLHPYTEALLRSMPPPLGTNSVEKRLPAIMGASEKRADGGASCSFEPRCPDRMSACSCEDPAEILTGEGRHVRCFKYAG